MIFFLAINQRHLNKMINMKIRILTLLFIMIATLSARSQKDDGDTTIYQFKVQSLDGEEFDFSSLEGKKIMTKQGEDLYHYNITIR